MKNFGFAGYDKVVYIGVNGKMNEASAAMGLTSLESIDHFIDTNVRNHARYREELRGTPGLSVKEFSDKEKNNHQYVVVEVDEERVGLNRDELVQVLWAENVMARRYFYPGCHQMEPYRSEMPDAGKKLQETERLSRRVMILPTGTAVDHAAIKKVCGIMKAALAQPALVRERLNAREG
jgi:dTDP-4-amino-4,6-dideoxygalactose transaminase